MTNQEYLKAVIDNTRKRAYVGFDHVEERCLGEAISFYLGEDDKRVVWACAFALEQANFNTLAQSLFDYLDKDQTSSQEA